MISDRALPLKLRSGLAGCGISACKARQRAAFVRAKIKNLETGAVVERTWNAGEKVQEGRVDRRSDAIPL